MRSPTPIGPRDGFQAIRAPVRYGQFPKNQLHRQVAPACSPQEEFARRIGISQNYLSTMERGKVQIGAEILLKISREFGKSIEWLLTGEDQKSAREER
jgi:transcriptional regulator with XRE-family HTH domain